MYLEKGKLFIDQDDICWSCQSQKRNICPLIGAIGDKCVYLSEDNIQIQNCGSYKKALQVVK